MSCWAQQVGTGGMRDKNLSQGCPHHHQPQQGTNCQHTHHSLPLIHGLDTLTQNQTLGVLHQTHNLPTLGALNPPTLTLGAQAPPTLILSQAIQTHGVLTQTLHLAQIHGVQTLQNQIKMHGQEMVGRSTRVTTICITGTAKAKEEK